MSIPGEIEDAIRQAREVARFAYAPYSHFHVGAVLIDVSGRQFFGCNVENASYGLTICAERIAAGHAIASGSRNWKRIIVVSPSAVAPCGACRQFLSEFGQDLEVWIAGSNPSQPVRSLLLKDLLPNAMGLGDVHGERS